MSSKARRPAAETPSGLRNLFRQRRWAERVKIVVLIGVCVWFAWGGSVVVVRFWAGMCC